MTTQRFDTIADIAGADDWAYDPYGTTVGLHFDIAEVLNMSDVEGDVTPGPFARWEYHPSPFVTVSALEAVAGRAEDFHGGEFADDYTYGVVSLATALHHGQITQSDLVYAGDVLSRYARTLENGGLSY